MEDEFDGGPFAACPVVSATRHSPQKAILNMKNLVFAIALVGLVAACNSTSKTSVADPAGANMPKSGCCSEKSAEGCTPEKKAACEGMKASGCEGMKAEAKTCPASKPQG